MKIAVLFHGIAGGMDGKNGKGEFINIEHCAQLWKENFYGDAEYDIFIHSWSVEAKEEIIKAFQPRKYLIEEQEYFNYQIETDEKYCDNNNTLSFKGYSRFTSAKKAWELMIQYKQETNINYDFVVLARIDLIFFNKINLSLMKNKFIYVCNNPFKEWQNIGKSEIIFEPFLIMNENYMAQFCDLINDLKNNKYSPDNSHRFCALKLKDMGCIGNIKFICTRFFDMDVYRFIFSENPNDGRPKEYEYPTNANRLFKLLKNK